MMSPADMTRTARILTAKTMYWQYIRGATVRTCGKAIDGVGPGQATEDGFLESPTIEDTISDNIGDRKEDILVKGKISATVEEPLLEFLDSMPGKTRSEKLERLLSKVKRLEEERELRRQLGEHLEDEDERLEREVWERTVSEVMWSE